MTTYHTKARRLRRPRHPARNHLADAANWLIVIALVAAIVLLLSSPLLSPT